MLATFMAACSADVGVSTGSTGPSGSGGATSIAPGTADETGAPMPPDLGMKLDAGADSEDGIPATCGHAATKVTTVGCLFFAVDLEQADQGVMSAESDQYAVAVSNVQVDRVARVTVERKEGGVWTAVEEPVDIEPLDLYAFELPDLHQDGSGVLEGGAYRISSDVPVIAYQFSPLMVAAASSDASMLYPVTSWDSVGHVVQWDTGAGNAYLTVVAAVDGTVIEVEPAVPTAPGPGVDAGDSRSPIQIALDEGDIAEVMVSSNGDDISGTVVTSDEDHPFGVFAGHECANIPEELFACDHLEEQLSGLRMWGTTFVASRVVPRQSPPEPSVWHIYASEDDTVVELTAPSGVVGLPESPVTLDRGEMLELWVGGTDEQPGDFLVQTSAPATVINYMTSLGNLSPASMYGDPAMVQLSPVEQFLPRYVVLVPSRWPNDYLVITRPTGSSTILDDEMISNAEFTAVVDDYEVARVFVEDGVHTLDGSEPFTVVVVGYGFANSYAYLGGMAAEKINPVPEG